MYLRRLKSTEEKQVKDETSTYQDGWIQNNSGKEREMKPIFGAPKYTGTTPCSKEDQIFSVTSAHIQYNVKPQQMIQNFKIKTVLENYKSYGRQRGN